MKAFFSRKLDKIVKEREKVSKTKKKILLLGAGGGGKSTIFRQISQIYGSGMSELELESYTNVIHACTMDCMQILISNAKKMEYEITCKEDADYVSKCTIWSEEFTHDLANRLRRLWKDEGIQKAWKNRMNFAIGDETPYFFEENNMKRMENPDYIPVFNDVLHMREMSTGMIENTIIHKGNKFVIVDVGGQRSERKKWIHQFEGVNAVVFVVGLSGYDQIMFEDASTLRIKESLKVMEGILNSEWFLKVPIIIILNKTDLFEEKIVSSPIKDFFPEYEGNSYKEAIDFFLEKYTSLNKIPERPIKNHVICALQEKEIKAAFDSIFPFVVDEVRKRTAHV